MERMTKQKYNRDIKRMYRDFVYAKETLEGDEYWDYEQGTLKAEFTRLYYEDPGAEYINLDNLKRMLVINRKCNFKAQDNFYLAIDQTKL